MADMYADVRRRWHQMPAAWHETDRAVSTFRELVASAIRDTAASMEAECTHKPCQHAAGLRLALHHLTDAARCPRCGADPGSHGGGCPVWKAGEDALDAATDAAYDALGPFEQGALGRDGAALVFLAGLTAWRSALDHHDRSDSQ